jgi:hypothetical protein
VDPEIVDVGLLVLVNEGGEVGPVIFLAIAMVIV